jgi:drug/metabolite transporter (DMT)-like permease
VAIVGAAAAGALCYYFGAILDFYALTLLDLGIERVLLYSYPSMVVLLYALVYRVRPPKGVVAALSITYVGILLVVSGFDLHVFRVNFTGSGLVLVTALTMAIYYLASDRYTAALGSIGYTLCALAAATACLVVHYTVRHGLAPPPFRTRDALLMAGLVLFATVLPMLLLNMAVQRLGPQRTAVISTVGPPATLILGSWLFAERLKPAQWSGVACIVGGILLLELARRRSPRSA